MVKSKHLLMSYHDTNYNNVDYESRITSTDGVYRQRSYSAVQQILADRQDNSLIAIIEDTNHAIQ